MKEKDFLIVGMGLCGAWLAYFLRENGCTVNVFDGQPELSASYASGGIVNPVTGRRVVTTWLADELMPWLSITLNQIGSTANKKFITEKKTLSFPGSLQMKAAYEKRIAEKNIYISTPDNMRDSKNYFNSPFPPYTIESTYIVHAKQFIEYIQELLQSEDSFIPNHMDESTLEIQADAVIYQSIKYKKIIYANGHAAMKSVYWKNLPFVPNKGQALIVEIPDLPSTAMYKFGMLTLVPIEPGIWWVGSSNELKFEHPHPEENFYTEANNHLKTILKTSFRIVQHLSAIRPAAVERRPFVGIHTAFKNVGILNGMGSKGCSLAPWFAKQLSLHLVENKPLDKDADVNRFSKLLVR